MLNESPLSGCFLVVEDNNGDFVLLKQYLQMSQLPINKIIRAETMSEVPELIKGVDIEVALLDLSLPDSLGVESVVTLNKLLPKTPIIVFSGSSTIDIAIKSIALGAQDYLVKGEFDVRLLNKSVHYSIERKRATEKTRETNERYELVNKATQDIIWEWDFHTSQGKWGGNIINLFSYSNEKLTFGADWLQEFVHPDDRQELGNKITTCIDSGGQNWQHEFRFLSADGSYKDVYDRAFILYDENSKPYRMIGAITDLTEKIRLEKELTNQQIEHQKTITEVTIQSQEDERNQLGKELHDNINQLLAAVKMFLGMAKSGKGVLKELIEKSYYHVDEAMVEIRKLCHTLVAPSLGDIKLLDALQDLIDDINVSDKIHINLACDDLGARQLNKKSELMLYRIIQEQVSNIIKYSKADNAAISFKKEEETLVLTISDNGVGFDTSKTAKGIGLKNIHNRVEHYSGKMKIASAPGSGCKLEIDFPFSTLAES